MSLWGATVITSLASAIPVVGNTIVSYLWGGFSVDNPTLNRFYSAHYLLPFVLAGLSILHLAALHQYGSTNPIGVNAQTDLIPFYPYYVLKDLAGFFVLAAFAGFLVFFYPDILGLKLAFKNSEIFYNNDMICWNILLFFKDRSARNIRFDFFKNTNYNNSIFSKAFSDSIVSSETIHVTPKSNNAKQNTLSSKQFNAWLAGLIDGDGSLCLNNGKTPVIEITLDAKDVNCLYMIKNTLGYGSVNRRTDVNAFRYRTTKKADARNLLNRINGLLLTRKKHSQLIKYCEFFKIKPIIPNYDQSVYIVKNTAWLSGFFDAEGHFNIMNEFTMAFHIGQKDKLILDIIFDALKFGGTRFDSSWNGWIFTICNQKGIYFILDFFTKYPLQTTKNQDTLSLKFIASYIKLKYHYKKNPNYSKVKHLVLLFKNRNK